MNSSDAPPKCGEDTQDQAEAQPVACSSVVVSFATNHASQELLLAAIASMAAELRAARLLYDVAESSITHDDVLIGPRQPLRAISTKPVLDSPTWQRRLSRPSWSVASAACAVIGLAASNAIVLWTTYSVLEVFTFLSMLLAASQALRHRRAHMLLVARSFDFWYCFAALVVFVVVSVAAFIGSGSRPFVVIPAVVPWFVVVVTMFLMADASGFDDIARVRLTLIGAAFFLSLMVTANRYIIGIYGSTTKEIFGTVVDVFFFDTTLNAVLTKSATTLAVFLLRYSAMAWWYRRPFSIVGATVFTARWSDAEIMPAARQRRQPSAGLESLNPAVRVVWMVEVEGDESMEGKETGLQAPTEHVGERPQGKFLCACVSMVTPAAAEEVRECLQRVVCDELHSRFVLHTVESAPMPLEADADLLGACEAPHPVNMAPLLPASHIVHRLAAWPPTVVATIFAVLFGVVALGSVPWFPRQEKQEPCWLATDSNATTSCSNSESDSSRAQRVFHSVDATTAVGAGVCLIVAPLLLQLSRFHRGPMLAMLSDFQFWYIFLNCGLFAAVGAGIVHEVGVPHYLAAFAAFAITLLIVFSVAVDASPYSTRATAANLLLLLLFFSGCSVSMMRIVMAQVWPDDTVAFFRRPVTLGPVAATPAAFFVSSGQGAALYLLKFLVRLAAPDRDVVYAFSPLMDATNAHFDAGASQPPPSREEEEKEAPEPVAEASAGAFAAEPSTVVFSLSSGVFLPRETSTVFLRTNNSTQRFFSQRRRSIFPAGEDQEQQNSM